VVGVSRGNLANSPSLAFVVLTSFQVYNPGVIAVGSPQLPNLANLPSLAFVFLIYNHRGVLANLPFLASVILIYNHRVIAVGVSKSDLDNLPSLAFVILTE